MKIKLCLFLLVIGLNSLFAQNSATIKGKVFSKTDNSPLFMVNIYLVGTTIGTTSNDKGEFEIKKVPAGKHEVIFSMIGYEPITKLLSINAEEKHDMGTISMNEKTYSTEEVAVVAKEDSDWQDNFEVFKKVFLGRMSFTAECDITNRFYVNFETKGGMLIAKVDRPLHIINGALGYEINCELLAFKYNFSDESYTFMVKSFFKELPTNNSFDASKWSENRRLAYFGSEQHFFKALLRNTFSEQWKVSKILRPLQNLKHTPLTVFNHNKSLLEYQSDHNNYKFAFEEYLEIIYKPRNLVSVIELTLPSVSLNLDGYFTEITPYITYGYWSQQGLSSMLPKYFDVMN